MAQMIIDRDKPQTVAPHRLAYKLVVPWLLLVLALVIMFRDNGGGVWLDPLMMSLLG